MQFICFLLLFFAASASAAPLVSVKNEILLPLRPGTSLSVYFKCPNSKSNKKYPVILLLGGFETGAGAIDLITTPSAFCLVTFQYPFSAPRKLEFPRDLKLLPEARTAMHDTVSGIHQVVSWIRLRREMDPGKIVLVGASFGSIFTSIAAREQKDISGLILVHGFGMVPKVIAHRILAEGGNKYGFTGHWIATLLGKLLWKYADMPSPEESLKNLDARQKVLLLTAEQDDLLPPEAVESLRNALRKSPAAWQERRNQGAHLRPEETLLIKELLEEATSWLRSEGFLR